MNRNVLLFVCLGLSASLLVFHFRPRVTNPVAPVQGAGVQPANRSSIDTTDIAIMTVVSAKATGETVSTSGASDTNAFAVAETAGTNVSDSAQKNVSAEDKYAALRELTAWAARDPEAALAAAMTLPEGVERDQALAAVCFGLAQKEPAMAVKLAEDLHLDGPPATVMEDLVQQWASSDLNSSLEWAVQQPASAARDEFMTRIAFSMSQVDPSDAANLVINQIPPGVTRDEAIMTVVHQWGMQNFIGAANWAKGSVTGPLQDRVLSELQGILDYQRAMAQPNS